MKANRPRSIRYRFGTIRDLYLKALSGLKIRLVKTWLHVTLRI
jgi:hypothetical protein